MADIEAELPKSRALVGHREFVHAADTLEVVHQRFAASREDFLAVLAGHELRGLCARREIGTLLGARYGFALYARARVAEHLTAHTIRVSEEEPLPAVLAAVAARRDEHFYDDVLLTDRNGEFLGLIYVRDLVRVQHTLLRGNIAELEARQAEIRAKNRQMEDDLRMAREVQMALLPREFPACQAEGGRALGFAHHYEPAGGVSGDFFDVFPAGDQAAGIIVCDVMGHGVRSALVTAMLRSMIEELRPQAAEPAVFLTRLNASLTRLLRRAGDMIFVTASYVVVDAAARRLTWAHAGHPVPLLWSVRRGSVEPLPDIGRIGGPALGLIEDCVYEAMERQIEEGDRVLLFTDGVFEAVDAGGEEFGVSRLAQSFAECAGAPLAGLPARLRQAASAFAGGASFADDVCLVVCELRR